MRRGRTVQIKTSSETAWTGSMPTPKKFINRNFIRNIKDCAAVMTNLKKSLTVIQPNPIESNPWMDPIHVQLRAIPWIPARELVSTTPNSASTAATANTQYCSLCRTDFTDAWYIDYVPHDTAKLLRPSLWPPGGDTDPPLPSATHNATRKALFLSVVRRRSECYWYVTVGSVVTFSTLPQTYSPRPSDGHCLVSIKWTCPHFGQCPWNGDSSCG